MIKEIEALGFENIKRFTYESNGKTYNCISGEIERRTFRYGMEEELEENEKVIIQAFKDCYQLLYNEER